MTVLLKPLWCGGSWSSLALDVLPSLLGFSIGAVAIILAAPGMKTFKLLAEDGDAESYFMDLAARLVHFIIVQVLGVATILAAKAYPSTGTNFVGFLLFSYALLSALSASLAIFGIARILNFAAKGKEAANDE